MRARGWMLVAATALASCMPTEAPEPAPGTDGGDAQVAEVPVRLSEDELGSAREAAGCTAFDEDEAGVTAQHVEEDAPPAEELYERRPAAAGDHLGAWVDAGVHEQAPDERAVVHNHEHGAVSVWYVPDAIPDDELELLRAWAEARNEHLANDAGAGVVVAPFDEALAGDAVVAFRAWTGGLDCAGFDPTVADGVLLERFGDAPEGHLAPPLEGVVERATSA